MTRLLALALLLGLATPATLAQSADLVGTWEVERLIDTAAEPAPESGLSAMLPDNPYTLAPVRIRFDASGEAVVSLVIARHDGYEVRDVPSAYSVEGGLLAISLGGFESDWEVDRQGDALVLRAEDGSALTLRRAP
ncbi:hypothetical protein [Rubrivirga sp. IMCC45206]|uniref:hypothetical protein n=1 Tax=Rubrivirga sp. IMCC45206 TaxID=3391614 RepID=UPI0039903123